MPRDKDFKRLVRARMKKTGEAYTAARAQLVNKTPLEPDFASMAGMSGETILAKTGYAWEHWVQVLDREGAAAMPHGEIARLVNVKHGVDGWWSQAVTVGYERIKGLRALGQRRDGTYEANKSRTFNVPLTTLWKAWATASARRRWMDGAAVKVRTATAPKSMRLGWDDGTVVVIGFAAKGKAKSVVTVQHTKLADAETAKRLKEYWSERFDALRDVLATR